MKGSYLRFYFLLKTKVSLLTTGVGEDAGKKEPSYTAGRNVN
jgi:hypothetical protein